MSTTTQTLISVKEAARRLSVTPWTVYQLCESGAIPSGRIDKQIVIRPVDVASYAASVVGVR